MYHFEENKTIVQKIPFLKMIGGINETEFLVIKLMTVSNVLIETVRYKTFNSSYMAVLIVLQSYRIIITSSIGF